MRFSTALGLSVAFHGVLAAGIALYLLHAPSGTVLAELDLSSVDLSFAEAESEAAPALDTPPPAPDAPSPPEVARPPEPETVPAPLLAPPEPEAVKLPEPRPETPRLDSPAPVEPVAPTRPSPTPPDPASPSTDTPTSRSPSVPPASASAPRQAHVDAPPALKKTLRPDYPRGARTRGEEGDVQLEIAVDGKGAVTGVRVLSACPFAELNEAAVKAARKARFTPARQGRSSVACTVRLTLTFRLRD